MLVETPLACAFSIWVRTESQLAPICGWFFASSSQHATYALHEGPSAPPPFEEEPPSLAGAGSVDDVLEPLGDGSVVVATVPAVHAKSSEEAASGKRTEK